MTPHASSFTAPPMHERRLGTSFLLGRNKKVTGQVSTGESGHGTITAVTRRRVQPRSARAALAGAALLTSVLVPGLLPGAPGLARAEALPVASQTSAAPLRIASFNIRNANSYTHQKNEKHWEDRRGTVVSLVRGEDLDVLAVQEATQGMLHDPASGGKVNQYEDLVNRLGGAWQVTNENHYNCVNAASPNRCTYRYNGASEGNRILFDASRVQLLAQGSKILPVPKGKGDNYMAWAQFRQRSSGKEFLVSNLHTVGTDKDYKIKNSQAATALAELKAHNPSGLPMVALGDWNSSRFERPSNGPYDTYVEAGFSDPLGQTYRTHSLARATVAKKTRVWLNSSNPTWARTAPNHKEWGLGSYIDYILTTKMHVSEWETVARLDSRGRYVGTIPSDHNMVRVTVTLS